MKAYTFISHEYHQTWWPKKFYASIDDLVLEYNDHFGGEILEFTYDDNSLPTITNRWELSQCSYGFLFEIQDDIRDGWIVYSVYDDLAVDDEAEFLILVEPRRNNLFLP